MGKNRNKGNRQSSMETNIDSSVTDGVEDTSTEELNEGGESIGDADAAVSADVLEETNVDAEEGTVAEEVHATGSVVEPAVATQSAPEPTAPQPGTVPTLQASSTAVDALAGFRHRMDEYIAAMGAAVPVVPKDGAMIQLRLYRLILEILRQEGTVFTRAWSDLLARVHGAAHGAFKPSRAFRFFELVKLDKREARVFHNLLHLILHTADPKARPTMLKHIDMGSVTANIPVARADDKLISFYRQ